MMLRAFNTQRTSTHRGADLCSGTDVSKRGPIEVHFRGRGPTVGLIVIR